MLALAALFATILGVTFAYFLAMAYIVAIVGIEAIGLIVAIALVATPGQVKPVVLKTLVLAFVAGFGAVWGAMAFGQPFQNVPGFLFWGFLNLGAPIATLLLGLKIRWTIRGFDRDTAA